MIHRGLSKLGGLLHRHSAKISPFGRHAKDLISPCLRDLPFLFSDFSRGSFGCM